MSEVAVFISIALAVGTIIALCMAFGQDSKQPGRRRRGRKQFSLKWFGLGVLMAALAVILWVAVFMPGIVRERIAEAESITRETFREKVGREPDKIFFDGINRKATWNGWKYVGTAQVGNEVWDVTVTSTNDPVARETTSECEVVPRK